MATPRIAQQPRKINPQDRHERCPGCLEWYLPGNLTGEIVYVITDDPNLFNVSVCERCAAESTVSARARIIERAHGYTTGRRVRVRQSGTWNELSGGAR